ncbi:Cytochrome c oxidase subunit 5C-2 [Artemisia annua]|uniref:Cytochrome c oxidase subunit 5C-2 n=1 Tax=Artemisia annua TaxID=35608 RepID=A0A2U1MFA6_ARTAN|nr:Cytochrome c oxidase subunit 5C-2 [Artemisia annua]
MSLERPSVVKELVIGLAAGGLWKMHHWNEQRKTRHFYDLLEKGEISVIVDEEIRMNIVMQFLHYVYSYINQRWYIEL